MNGYKNSMDGKSLPIREKSEDGNNSLNFYYVVFIWVSFRWDALVWSNGRKEMMEPWVLDAYFFHLVGDFMDNDHSRLTKMKH